MHPAGASFLVCWSADGVLSRSSPIGCKRVTAAKRTRAGKCWRAFREDQKNARRCTARVTSRSDMPRAKTAKGAPLSRDARIALSKESYSLLLLLLSAGGRDSEKETGARARGESNNQISSQLRGMVSAKSDF